MHIAILGTGYVGLTTGLVFAYLGHEVTCVDIDRQKIASLRKGRLPFYEPHAERLLADVRARIRFATDYREAVPHADAVFIAVGTPAAPDARPVLDAVEQAACAIGEHLNSRFTVVVNKSTVLLGTGNWVRALIREAFENRNGRALALRERRPSVPAPEFAAGNSPGASVILTAGTRSDRSIAFWVNPNAELFSEVWH